MICCSGKGCGVLIAAVGLLLLGGCLGYHYLCPGNSTKASAQIGVVSMGRVMSEATVYRKLSETRSQKAEEVQRAMSTIESKLKALDTALMEKKNVLSQLEFDKEVSKVRGQVARLQQRVNGVNYDIERSDARAREAISEKVSAVIERVAAREKLNAVVASESMLYVGGVPDITSQVIGSVDEDVQDIGIEFPRVDGDELVQELDNTGDNS